MRAHHAAGRSGDAEIAVLRIAPQALFEGVSAMMRGDESVLAGARLALGSSLRRSARAAARPFFAYYPAPAAKGAGFSFCAPSFARILHSLRDASRYTSH